MAYLSRLSGAAAGAATGKKQEEVTGYCSPEGRGGEGRLHLQEKHPWEASYLPVGARAQGHGSF